MTLFEKADRIGGLLRYGIPDFKMEKRLIDRRMRQMEAEGVEFRTGVEVGATLSIKSLLDGYDAVALTGGAEWPRDLEVPGRELAGIHFAMDFLTQQNKRVAGDDEARPAPSGTISANGKHVVVIGGGDTGSDCVGTSNRQGAASVTQLEIMPQPPERENKALTWPDWPLKMRTSSSHEEGVRARLRGADQARRRQGRQDRGPRVRARRLGEGRRRPHGHAGGRRAAAFELKADLVLLAMGFLGPRRPGMVEQSGVDARSARQRRGQRPGLPDLACPSCSPPATCGAASRWSSGRSARAASAPARSMKA